jgi:colanic acid/amylovoran biosynthesis glycosyltransferase
LVVPAFPKLSESFIVSKVVGLLETGWDVHVVCRVSEPAEWRHFPRVDRAKLSGRVHVAPPARPRWRAVASAVTTASTLRRPRRLARYLARGAARLGPSIFARAYLDAHLIRLAPDLVHFEFGSLAVDRMYLKELLGCVTVASFRGYDINYVGLDDPGYYQDVWERADAVHFLGEDLRSRAIARGCPPRKPHVLIPPAIDAAFFDPGDVRRNEEPATEPAPLRILSVGRLVWKKGYEYALVAVRKLLDKGVDCRYTIVGDGPYLEALSFARHQLGLDGVVHFAGSLTREEVRSRMLAADVFLHPAVSEGFCNAVIEAQAMTLPVVCSDADGLAENVAHGRTGFVVPRRDPDALAAPLIELAADRALRRRIGRAGRERVLSRFTLPDQIRAFDTFYRSVLGMPPSLEDEPAAVPDARAAIAS